MYLLKVSKKGSIFKDADSVLLVPEFQKLLKAEGMGETALKWVALMHDYESPYRYLSIDERAKAVSKDLYNDFKWKGSNSAVLKSAVEKYKKLQFDPLDEQLIAFNAKIDQFTKYMNSMVINDDNAESLQKLMIGIEKILKTRQTLLDVIERRGERQKIVGDKQMSFLENKLNRDNDA
jgi:hypothetical protein